MTNLDNFKSAKEKVQAAMEDAKKVMREAFNEEAKRLFDAHPTLTQFAWTQYTPYFNDGEECVFHTNETGIWFSNSEGEADDSVYDHEFSDWELKKKAKSDLTANESAGLDTLAFLSIFDESDMKELFGDHVEVRVTKRGVVVEEYEHD